MKINIFDNCFSHLIYSIPDRNSKYIEYEKNKLIYEGITIFTDNYINGCGENVYIDTIDNIKKMTLYKLIQQFNKKINKDIKTI